MPSACEVASRWVAFARAFAMAVGVVCFGSALAVRDAQATALAPPAGEDEAPEHGTLRVQIPPSEGGPSAEVPASSPAASEPAVPTAGASRDFPSPAAGGVLPNVTPSPAPQALPQVALAVSVLGDVCEEGLEVFVQARPVPPGGMMGVLTWRLVGGAYTQVPLLAGGDLLRASIPRPVAGEVAIEYYLAVYDLGGQLVGAYGGPAQPIGVRKSCRPRSAVTESFGGRPRSRTRRFSLGLGFGFGVGLARGHGELVYRQYAANSVLNEPDGSPGQYGLAEHACALARWWAAGGRLPTSAELLGVGASGEGPLSLYGANGREQALAAAYDPKACGQRQPISAGGAVAPFHLAPEFMVRLTERVSVGLFGRFQVVTGSNVWGPSPGTDRARSFESEVGVPRPLGTRIKPPVTWALGLKVRVRLGEDHWRVQPFVGGFVGLGTARLRLPLGLGQDRNGNSVPDRDEVAPFTRTGEGCVPIWPYNGACQSGGASTERTRQDSVRQSASGEVADTFRMGTGFFGALGGVLVPIHPMFAVFVEAQLGVWFPKSTSVLFDASAGPMLRF